MWDIWTVWGCGKYGNGNVGNVGMLMPANVKEYWTQICLYFLPVHVRHYQFENISGKQIMFEFPHRCDFSGLTNNIIVDANFLPIQMLNCKSLQMETGSPHRGSEIGSIQTSVSEGF